MTSTHWQPVQNADEKDKPQVEFTGHEGFPQGVMTLKSGSVALNDFSFRDGTIEFDMKAIGEDIPGIQFRRQGVPRHQNAEEFYLRSSPDCRASNDCIQYAPVIRGAMLWNVYPQHQRQAPVIDGWNHYKLVVSGHRMNVFINNSPQPVLAVGYLESGSPEGAIQLRGPAYFANLAVSSNAVEGLRPQPTPDPTAADAGIVRRWQVGPETSAVYGMAPSIAQAPGEAVWRSITADRSGLVNLNREFDQSHKDLRFDWLRTVVISDTNQEKLVQLGWLGKVWVFVNGKLVTQGNNYYYPEGERRMPDGRLSLENGSFRLPLQRGTNQIVLVIISALASSPHGINFYGSGAMLRFVDLRGLHLVTT